MSTYTCMCALIQADSNVYSCYGLTYSILQGAGKTVVERFVHVGAAARVYPIVSMVKLGVELVARVVMGNAWR